MAPTVTMNEAAAGAPARKMTPVHVRPRGGAGKSNTAVPAAEATAEAVGKIGCTVGAGPVMVDVTRRPLPPPTPRPWAWAGSGVCRRPGAGRRYHVVVPARFRRRSGHCL